MKVHHNLSDLPAFQNAIITIGSFDGVHHGHQQILDRLKQLAQAERGESIVITFDPHPRLVLRGDDHGLRLLTTIEEKAALFEKYGIDHMVIVPFTKTFANQSAEEYIEQFLVAKFQPRFIVIGYDHRFGKDRVGNIDYLRHYQDNGHFEIVEIEQQEVKDIAVSSTKIRQALEKGDVKTAGRLLKHPYALSGTVVKGQQIGHELGFPTANLSVDSPYKLIPPAGIYAVRAYQKGQSYDAALYIGDRPTLEELTQRTIEVHLFDFDQDIYGEELSIEFVDFIRGDAKFKGLDALREQIARDVAAVKIVLAKLPDVSSKKKSTHRRSPSSS